MPSGVIGWLSTGYTAQDEARRAIVDEMAHEVPRAFADVFNAKRVDHETELTPKGQEYGIVRYDIMSYNLDDVTVTINMRPGRDGCVERRAEWMKHELAVLLSNWLRARPQFKDAGIRTLQIDLRFMPMSGIVVNLKDNKVASLWGDISVPKTTHTAP